MKRIVMLAMAFVMMLASLGGCYWWGPEGHGGRGGHDRGGDSRGGERGGGHEERH
jgi:hypothetical protein